MLKCKVRNAFLVCGPLMIMASLYLNLSPFLTIALGAFGIGQLMILLFRGWT